MLVGKGGSDRSGQTYGAGSSGKNEYHAHCGCCTFGAGGVVEDLNEGVAGRGGNDGIEVA